MKTLLKFEADWCGPCQQVKPLVDRVMKDFEDTVQLEVVDVDDPDNRGLVTAHGVRAIPTFVLTDGERVVATHRGALNHGELSALLRS